MNTKEAEINQLKILKLKKMKEMKQFEINCRSKEWRITSGELYKIVDKEGQEIPFIPNDVQLDFMKKKHKKNIILKSRQHGMTTFIDLDDFDDVLFEDNLTAGIIAQNDAAVYQIFDNKITFAYDKLPESIKKIRTKKIDRAGEIKFNENGGKLYVGNSFRSGTLQRLHVSEFGDICLKFPERAREIITGALNTVSPSQRVDIESTAKGASGPFYDMCMKALALQESGADLTDMDYKFFFYPWFVDKTCILDANFIIIQETSNYFEKLECDEYIKFHYPYIVFSDGQKRWYQKKLEEQKDDMIREYPSTPTEAFEVAIKGAYYEKEMQLIRKQNRICRVNYNPNLDVHTAWDIGGAGGGDAATVIFFQLYGSEIRVIDYFEGIGYSMLYIAKQIILKKGYNLGSHYLPHDANVTSQTTGIRRVDALDEVLDNIEVLERDGISDGIDLARNTLNRCVFDEEKTGTLTSHLGMYSKKWDDRNGIWMDKPDKKGGHSHGADAFRGLSKAVSLMQGDERNSDIDIEKLKYQDQD